MKTTDESAAQRMHILYIVYWGVLEPLGQALVVPPLLRCAAAGLRVTLVTFEKPHHLADRTAMEKNRRQLRAAGIKWLPLKYHQRPTAPATAYDIAHGVARSLLLTLRHRPTMVHGRTYVGGIIGSLASRVLRRPFIFHGEGFWPDEKVDSGCWAKGSWVHRTTQRQEKKMFRRADAVIVLSDVAHNIVGKWRAARPPASTVTVPSCVNLEEFRPAPEPLPQLQNQSAACPLVYVGSLGGRYRLDQMAHFLKMARREMPSTRLTIYSHSDPEMIRSQLQQCDVEDGWWSLEYLPHDRLPQALLAQSAGLHFLTPGINACVGSPTKIGEYWACGLPTVVSSGMGDIDTIVRRERVGVVVETDTDDACTQAARELRLLLEDRELPQRCRRAAEQYYSLEQGVQTQLQLYRWVAQQDRSSGEKAPLKTYLQTPSAGDNFSD